MSEIDYKALLDKGLINAGEYLDNLPGVGVVTDRSEIIDPYALVDPANYRKNRKGQAAYNSDLQQAIRYAEMQEASYKEWYESDAQKAIRAREAGLNPDIVGVGDSEAADVQPNHASPIAGQQTNFQVFREGLQTILDIASTSLNIATGFSQIPLNKSSAYLNKTHQDNLDLQNIQLFENLAYGAISDKLAFDISAAADSGSEFNIDDWFANDANFSPILVSYAPDESPRYSEALARVRRGSQKSLSEAYKMGSDSASNQSAFSRALANPYMDRDVLTQIAIVEPLMTAYQDLENITVELNNLLADIKSDYASGLDVDSAVDAQNAVYKASQAKNEYDAEYYQELDAKIMSKAEQIGSRAAAVISSAEATVLANFKNIFNNHKSDPLGISAAYTILSGGAPGIKDFVTQMALYFATEPKSDGPVGRAKEARHIEWITNKISAQSVIKMCNELGHEAPLIFYEYLNAPNPNADPDFNRDEYVKDPFKFTTFDGDVLPPFEVF